MKKIFKSKNVFFIIISILLIIFLVGFLGFKNKNISEILSTKYDSIVCIDKYCDNVVALQSKNKNKYVKILDKNKKVIGKYNYTKTKKDPFYISKKYILMTKKVDNKNYEYSINKNNNSIKEIYKTNNPLNSINSNLVLEMKKSNIDYDYDIITSEGKKILKNIREFESYNNGKILYGIKDDHSYIISKTGKILLDEYKVEEEREKYLVLKSSKEAVYYYFDIQKQKIKNTGFLNYIIEKDNTLSVIRKQNNKEIIYKISEDGKEEKIDNNSSYAIIKKVQEDTKNKNYKIYSESIVDGNTDKIFVDNRNNNSFGIYDIKNKKYQKMYDYLTNVNETKINKIKSLNEKVYFQVSCSKPICLESKLYVIDYENNKILFKNEDSNNIIVEYHHYENNYKVVKYSDKSKNGEYKGKYVLYNDNNEVLEKSDKYITVIDSKMVIGKKSKKTLLYSSKDNKLINDTSLLANLAGNKYYIYDDKLLDENSKIIYQDSKKLPLYYSNDYVYSVDDKNICVYDINSKTTYTYKLSKNETIVVDNNKKISPFHSYIFINNRVDNYTKMIDMRENKNNTKRVNNTVIYSAVSNKNKTKEYIIIKNPKTSKYGLYRVN